MTHTNGRLSTRGSVFSAPNVSTSLSDILSNQWNSDSNAGGCVCLGVAENRLLHAELEQFLSQRISTITSHTLTYGDGFNGSVGLRDAIAAFMTRYFLPFSPVLRDHVSVTSGVGPAIEACSFLLCDPGDAVLLGRPYYGSIPGEIYHRARVQTIGVSFGRDIDPFSMESCAAYEGALLDARANGVSVRAMILCNPHNPLGRCYSRPTLERYLRFCQKYQIHLISDEVYALSTWINEGAPHAPNFTSVLSINLHGIVDPSLIHVLWGISKDFGSSGLRIGCVVSQSNAPFRRALQANAHYTYPSSLSDVAARALLADTKFVDSFLQENRRRLAHNYALTTRTLNQERIAYTLGCNAGFFIWVDLFSALPVELGKDSTKGGTASNELDLIAGWITNESDDSGARKLSLSTEEMWALEAALSDRLLKHGVFVASGTAFGSEVPGWFRIVFSHPEPYLLEGLERIIGAVRDVATQIEPIISTQGSIWSLEEKSICWGVGVSGVA
ncbi:putative 1-aminocyclopropane-1-carboxylate synthase [Xylariaceae sp. FL1272]|nr:putative 1-aminocyclopropane-1-carboxylate synthase [Xylariaceae sp. FL1272]